MKMEWISIITLLLISSPLCGGSKETLGEWETLMDDPDFLRKIVKRLGLDDPIEENGENIDASHANSNTDPIPNNSGADSNIHDTEYVKKPPTEQELKKPVFKKKDKTVKDSFGNKCEYNTNSNSIIRTTDSLNAGAFFLKFFNNITAQECVSGCCYTQGCNLAVYENKVKI